MVIEPVLLLLLLLQYQSAILFTLMLIYVLLTLSTNLFFNFLYFSSCAAAVDVAVVLLGHTVCPDAHLHASHTGHQLGGCVAGALQADVSSSG
jgi:hypothetical protein